MKKIIIAVVFSVLVGVFMTQASIITGRSPSRNGAVIGATGSGSQTPWTSAIDGGGYALTNAGAITGTSLTASGAAATTTLAGGLYVDSGGLTVDYSTNSTGIGNANPSVRFDVTGDSLFAGSFMKIKIGADRLTGNRGIQITPAAYDGAQTITGYNVAGGTFSILGQSTTNPTAVTTGIRFNPAVPTTMDFFASTTNSVGTVQPVMRLAGLNLGIGTTTPRASLSVTASSTAPATWTLFDVASSTGAALFTVNNSGTITQSAAAAYAGSAMCYATGGVLGHCTDTVGAGGTCTCVAN